jgi:hypothetical protein
LIPPLDPELEVPCDTEARKRTSVTVIAYGRTMGWKLTNADELANVVMGAPFCQFDRPPKTAVRTDEFDMPKETPLLFEKETVPEVASCVPAERLTGGFSCPPPAGKLTVTLAVATPTSAILPAVLLNPTDAVDPTDVLPISRSGPT